MAEDDDLAAAEAFSTLINSQPDLHMPLVADILHQCDHDYKKAYEVLLEMVFQAPEQTNQIPSPSSSHPQLSSTQSFHSNHSTTPDSSPSESRYKLPVSPSLNQSPLPPPHTSPTPSCHFHTEEFPMLSPSVHPPPRGAWAITNMGRKYRVDQLCQRYQWISRSVVEALLEKYQDCVELAEADILEMFPIDEPQAYARTTSSSTNQQPVTHTTPNRTSKNPFTRPVQSPRQQVFAESLRQQAVEEIRREASRQQATSQTSTNMLEMRKNLWDKREERIRLHRLANQTRKPQHLAQAKNSDAQLEELSSNFLEIMRNSQEYRNGIIDLHGLTKEESLQLVKWKLQEGGQRRFRVITGKGIHSQNGQAVLKPALEKFFQSNRISYTLHEDAIMSVAPS